MTTTEKPSNSSIDISDVVALVNTEEVEDSAIRVDRLLTDQSVNRQPMNMVAFD
ncbi:MULTISPECIES: hypothetical protein [unclassified Pseudonocardia]|uniref:hypothetical protein n=1 Tax=unclassified Pseudonocardia TaxID=2619320 RepID=UPI000A9612AE|nr:MULTISPECIES: hypothetical protein [unclassified Pseudonocardia]